MAELRRGHRREAEENLQAAAQCSPQNADILNNLAWLLATCSDQSIRDGARAVELAERATELFGVAKPPLLDTLAAAYAELGEYDKAIATASYALELSRKANKDALAERIEHRLDLYRKQQPYHQ